MEKLKKWLNKPMNMKVFVGSVLLMVIFYLFYLLVTNVYDMDMYFLIATGREIIENGIPHTNVWTIDSNIGFIAQQWLYDVVLAVVDKFGIIGFTVFCGLQFAGLIVLMNKFLSIRKLGFGMKCLFISVTVMLSQYYIFSVRPELITLIFLLLECIALDEFRLTKRWTWLILLPVTMLLEVNFHASMWPIHYAILLAYVVPSFYLPGVKNDDLHMSWKPIGVSTLIMTGVMFINPYGLDGILYIVKSFMASTFDYVNVVEVSAPEILSVCGVSIIVGIILFVLCHKQKVLCSTSTNITFGFLFLAATSIRHNMFVLFVLLFLFRDLCPYLEGVVKNIDWKKDVKNSLYPVLIAGNIFVFGLYYLSVTNMFITDTSSVGYQLSSIYDYIETNSDDDVSMFTGFNCGAYFEYKGIKNVYIDARPEIYTSEITGGKHILRDYSRYALYGYSAVIDTDADLIPVSAEEMDDWFYSYDFDYVLVTVKSEMTLASYMRTNEDYMFIEELSGTTYSFYEKKDKPVYIVVN